MLNRFVVFATKESDLTLKLINKMNQLKHKIPLLDLCMENCETVTKQQQFQSKMESIFTSFRNEFHAFKLSGLNYNAQKIVPLISYGICNQNKIVVDAEEDIHYNKYLSIMNILCKKFNKNDCNIFKTYQMYRKDSMKLLEDDLKKYNNQFHGIKLVRGAYISHDSHVIFDTKQQVDDNYFNAIQLIHKHLKNNPKLHCIFATHNKTNVEYVNKHIKPAFNDRVYCAHLMGFHTQHGDMVYIPYGSVIYAFPYLIRRFCENPTLVINSLYK